jgi:hypothetical protein
MKALKFEPKAMQYYKTSQQISRLKYSRFYLAPNQEAFLRLIIEKGMDQFLKWMKDPLLSWLKTRERNLWKNSLREVEEVQDADLLDAYDKIISMVASVLIDLHLGKARAPVIDENLDQVMDEELEENLLGTLVFDEVFYSLEHDADLLPVVDQVIQVF